MQHSMYSKHVSYDLAIFGATHTATANGEDNSYEDCHALFYGIQLKTINTLTAGDRFEFTIQEYINGGWADINAKNLVFYKEVPGGAKATWDGIWNDTTTPGGFTVDVIFHEVEIEKIRLKATAVGSPSADFQATQIKTLLLAR